MEPSKAKKLAIELMQEWDLTPKWSFEFDNAKRRFGCCKISKKKITLSKHLTKRNEINAVKDTILHEIAHALDYKDRGTSDHSKHWKQWARKVGANPTRCYDSQVVNTVEPPYYDWCPNCGHKRNRYKRHKSNRPQSCGKCDRSYNPNYPVIRNIPADVMEQIELGEKDWTKLPQTIRAIAKLEQTEPQTALAHNPVYQQVKNPTSNKIRRTKPPQSN